jgi:rod shape-determining protein MreD
MTTWIRLPPIVFVALVLQTALVPELRVLGVAPNVLLLPGVAAAVVAGPERGATVGFVCGLLADLYLVRSPFGLSALTSSLAAYAVGLLQGSLLDAPWWTAVVSVAGGSALGTVLFTLGGAVVGQPTLPTDDLLTVVGVVALVNAALSVVAVPVLRWAIVDAGPSKVGS